MLLFTLPVLHKLLKGDYHFTSLCWACDYNSKETKIWGRHLLEGKYGKVSNVQFLLLSQSAWLSTDGELYVHVCFSWKHPGYQMLEHRLTPRKIVQEQMSKLFCFYAINEWLNWSFILHFHSTLHHWPTLVTLWGRGWSNWHCRLIHCHTKFLSSYPKLTTK